MRYENEQFVELFDTDLVTLPTRAYLPEWFTAQSYVLSTDAEDEATLKSSMHLPLISDDVKYDAKKSLIDDDDD